MKFGVHLPIPSVPTDKLIKVAQLNEEAGFDSVWVPDHILFIPPGIVPEAWSVLAAIAAVTKRVTLGTCVTDPHRYHPAVLAQKVATVDQLSGGRAILGLGAGESMNLDPFGIKWDRPVSRLIEAISIVRKLWSGEIFSYEGKFWNLKDAFLHIQPVRRNVPIYLAANGPRTLRLTGEIADGWLPTPLTPELYAKRLRLVKEGATKAGRSIDEIDTGIYLYTSIADRAEEAYETLEKFKPMIAHLELLREAGYEVKIPSALENLSYFKLLPTRDFLDRMSEYGDLIPLEAAREFSLAGTKEECIQRIEEYIKAGVRHFDLINIGPDPKKVMDTYSKEIIPCFREDG